MVTRREIYLISEEDKRKSKKLFSLISLAISCVFLIFLFLPSATIKGISIGSIIGGSQYSNVHNLLCLVLVVLIFGRVLLALFSLAVVRLENIQRIETNFFTVTLVSSIIHIVVYVASVVFALVYIDTQLAYFNFDTSWLKVGYILVLFPHGLIKELINYFVIARKEVKVVESSASSYTRKKKAFLIWKFVPAFLIFVLFMFMMPMISEGFYSHQEIYPVMKQDQTYTIGKSIKKNKFKLTFHGEEVPFATGTYYLEGANGRLYQDMIDERVEKFLTATGGAKEALAKEITTLTAAKQELVISYETLYCVVNGDKITIEEYVYNANPTEKAGDEKAGKDALNFIDEMLYSDEASINNNIFRIGKDKTTGENELDFATEEVYTTVKYNDGSMVISRVDVDNYEELNVLSQKAFDKKYNSGPALTEAEKFPMLKWTDAWGTQYSAKIEIK